MRKFFTIFGLVFFAISLSIAPTALLAQENITEQYQQEDSSYKENESAVSQRTGEKVLYLSYETIPSSVLTGEIFRVTLKVLSTVKNFKDIKYTLSNAQGIKSLYPSPLRAKDAQYYYETFFFIATSQNIKLPNFEASLITEDEEEYQDTTLEGSSIEVLPLNPKKDFSNIVADSFELIEYKTTSFDDTHNIVVFVATANNCDISSLKLQNTHKQGIESISASHLDSKITYYAVIDKKIENLSFSYFNLKKNRFVSINIPIVLNDDSVTTQSDLKPIDQSHQKLKIVIAIVLASLIIALTLWKKNYKHLLWLILPIGYIVLVESPSKEVCIKADTNIYLLPVHNGTVFEKTNNSFTLQKEGQRDGWTKIQLENKKIGWVKNEDLCSN
ncbi:MAG: hypothetical protein QG559_1628 [Campylobacterota bacterium]|nr:hypothetical protein [Campylobacterota bacterium]